MTARAPGYGVDKQGEPAFAVRGVVEGFYGTPWTHEQRVDMMRFIGERGMNRFVYAPKDDPLVRRQWREPYAGSDLERLARLVSVGEETGAEVVYCLSPGLTIRYSDGDDVAALLAKFDSVLDLGVRHLGLLLDDIPPVLQHESDRAVFPTLATAHARLGNAVAEHVLARGATLVLCPTQYFGRGTESYITELGAGLDERVDVFWTGRLICSPSLDVHDAEIVARSMRRPPLFWDNYPVNDLAMADELHIGPYREREAGLPAVSRGIIANAMEFAEASKIAIATIADFAWSPEAYDPETSWRVAIADVVGDADADAFLCFAENSRTSCLSLDDAEPLARALERADFLADEGRLDEAATVLGALDDRYAAAVARLRSGEFANPRLVAEARPWIEAYAIGVHALSTIARLTGEGRLESDGPAELAADRDALHAARRRIFGDVLDMALTQLVDPVERRTTAPFHSPTKEAAS